MEIECGAYIRSKLKMADDVSKIKANSTLMACIKNEFIITLSKEEVF